MVTTSRLELVRRRSEQWANALVDLTPRNPLLYFKDTASTLDLTDAAAPGLDRLVMGNAVRLSALVPDPDARTTACRRLRSVRKRVVLAAEEQGIEIGRLARGLVRVEPPAGRGSAPVRALRAPLLLQPVRIEPRTAAENDYSLTVEGDLEVNPVLLVALQREHGIDLDVSDLGDRLAQAVDSTDDPDTQVGVAFDILQRLLSAQHRATELEQRTVVGCFVFDKLPMMEDLLNSAELLAEHDVVAAAAGDLSAMAALRHAATGHRPQGADQVAPADEFLVLDADSSQHDAARAVLDGQHVVIQGPPGTGKSQTIANVIGAAAADGKRVLFVTEKRAAIEAVTERLAEVGLAELVLDLHAQRISRREVAQQVAKSLDLLGSAMPPDVEQLHRRLAVTRRQLVRYTAETHEVRAPWGLSAHAVQHALLGMPAHVRSAPLLPRAILQRLDGGTVDDLSTRLTTYVDNGGLTLRRGDSAWSGATVHDEREAEELLLRLDGVTGRAWQQSRQALIDLVQRAGLPQPVDLTGWTSVLALLADVERSALTHGLDVHGPELDRRCAAAGDRAWRRRHPTPDGWWRRRALRKELLAQRRGGPCDRKVLFAELGAAVAERDAWRELAGNPSALPRVIGLRGEPEAFSRLRDDIAAIALSARLGEPEQVPVGDVESTLARLRGEEVMLQRLPELSRITADLEAYGLGGILDEVARRDCDPEEARQVLRHTWYRSLLTVFHSDSPVLTTFSGPQHDAAVAEFRDLDARHLRLNSARIKRRVAERLRDARDAHGDQNTRVLAEANRKRGHMAVRKLVASAPDVLLAARPCWAMSPIVVSRLLPAQRLFDIVVFDEASQVEPVDAMASIMRGTQLVVAGDDKQLPPSDYFRRLTGGSSGEDDEGQDLDGAPPLPGIGQFESVLTCLATFVPQSFRLRWHYRSADERLIAFSNEEFYQGSLVTFPGRDEESPLQLHPVKGHAAPGTRGLLDAEVTRIVELVVTHAVDHPTQSLGVITANVEHQERIEEALRRAGAEHPSLDEFRARMTGPRRRLFVKSLETVQGDERDVIVLSIGRAKGADGRLSLNLGPINRDGGERRLNVAVTRARTRMHVVSAITHEDLPPTSQTKGPEVLRRFLATAAAGGRPRDVGRAVDIALNPLEQQVLAELTRRGIPATPQWGVAGYRIDFALADPERQGRMVLALEVDGDSYHRLASARDRDRLRQNHLENMGWDFHRVWASAWFTDPDGQADRIERHWKEVLAAPRVDPEPSTPDDFPAPAFRHGPRPPVEPGRGNITLYTDDELDTLARWIASDGLPLDRETRLVQMRHELGFARRGSRIDERCGAALDRVRR